MRSKTSWVGSDLATHHIASPNIDDRKAGNTIDILLLHYTGMESAEISCERLCDPQSQVSCHYLVDEQGVITQMVDEQRRAWHAGKSRWKELTDINSQSIGIEIQNRGHQLAYDDFPHRQMEAVVGLCRDIIHRQAIPQLRVLAHSDVAPLRKMDPGEKFDWGFLHAEGIGHWVKPEPISGGPFLQLGDHGAAVEALQGLFYLYGYGLGLNGQFDEETQAVVKAFQRHFRPERVDGVADPSTVMTLHRLLRAI